MRKVVRISLLLALIFIAFISSAQAVEITLNDIEGMELPVKLNVAGEIHNEYQEAILSQLVAENVSLQDPAVLERIIRQKTAEFFSPKGLNTENYSYEISFDAGTSDITFPPEAYSPRGLEIMNQLRVLIQSYDESNDEAFFIGLNGLREAALSLPDEREALAVGIPVSIAIHSYSYWKQNAGRWSEALIQQNSVAGWSQNSVAGRSKPCRVGLGQLGAADVVGGIRGGIWGVTLGPGGIFAGAVLGSSTASLANLSGQIMSCLFDWW